MFVRNQDPSKAQRHPIAMSFVSDIMEFIVRQIDESFERVWFGGLRGFRQRLVKAHAWDTGIGDGPVQPSDHPQRDDESQSLVKLREGSTGRPKKHFMRYLVGKDCLKRF